MRKYSATREGELAVAVVLGQPVGAVAVDRARHVAVGGLVARVPAHEVAHLGAAAHPQQRRRHRGAVADPRARVAPRARLERRAVAVHEDVRGRGAQRVDALGSGAEADRDRAEPLLPRARDRIERRARAERRSASASHAPAAARRTAPRPPPSRAAPARELEVPAQRARRVREVVAHRARAAAARRATRWRVTPPCSNAAAPKPLGGSSGITTLRPFTATAPSLQASSQIGLVPPMPWKDCQGGVTWNGRSAANRRTRCAASPCSRRGSARARTRRAPAPLANAVVVSARSRQRQCDDGIGRHDSRERLRDLGVRPGDELAVGEQERLEREAGAVRLEHPLLVQDRRGRPALDTDRCPVGSARGGASAGAARGARARRRRGRSRGASARTRRARRAATRSPKPAGAGGLVQQQPQLPRAPAARQVDVVARALRLARGPERPPVLAVVARLHLERARLAAGRPVDRRARRTRAPRGSRARATAAARRARCASCVAASPSSACSAAMARRGARRAHARRLAQREVLEAQVLDPDACRVRRAARRSRSRSRASSRSGPPPAGPHANVTSLLRIRSGCQSAGNSNASRCHHQTLRLRRIDELQLELVRGRRAAHAQRERPALRHRAREPRGAPRRSRRRP